MLPIILFVEINCGKNIVKNVENNHTNVLYVKWSLKRRWK